MLKGRALKQHSDKCVVRSGLDGFALDGRLNNNSDDRKAPPKLPADISQEMRAKMEEFGIANLSVTPEKIWWMVKNWADKEYERNWFGLRKDQVKNLILQGVVDIYVDATQAMHPIRFLSVPHISGVRQPNQFPCPYCLRADVTQERSSVSKSSFRLSA